MTVRKEHQHSSNQAASLLCTRILTFPDYLAWLVLCLSSPGLLWYEESWGSRSERKDARFAIFGETCVSSNVGHLGMVEVDGECARRKG
jgi:hypothetical protein